MRTKMGQTCWRVMAAGGLVAVGASCFTAAAAAAIAIEDPPAGRVVDFGADILPILQRNCLACHSASKAEGEIVLETPEAMRAKRDEGALVVATDVAASRLLKIAAQQDEPAMPPEDNKVGAVALKPAELGLLKRWIEQGAKDSAAAKKTKVNWQPLPEAHRPILAAAVSPAGDLAVCSRGGELLVYGMQPGVQRGALLARLVDPALDAAQVGPRGAAHVDLVRAVAIHDNMIASAGFRTLKLWQRHQPVDEFGTPPADTVAATANGNGKRLAIGTRSGAIQVVDVEGGQPVVTWKGHNAAVIGLAFARGGAALITAAEDGQVRAWQASNGALLAGWRLSAPPKQMIVPADDLLITGSDDLAARVWTIAIPAAPHMGDPPAEWPRIEPTRLIAGHSRRITSLAAVPGSPRQYLTGSLDGTARQWNADDAKQLGVWIHGDAVTGIVAAPDGSRFVSLGDDRTVRLWSMTGPAAFGALTGDYRQAWRIEQQTRQVEVARTNAGDAQSALQAVEKAVAADQQAREKALTALAEATKNLETKTAAFNDAKSKHDAGSATIADLAQRIGQADKSLADSQARLTNSDKEHELIAAVIKLAPASEQVSAAERALATIREDRAAYLKELVENAQDALAAVQKLQQDAQNALASLTKQKEEAQKVVDAATAAQKDAQAGVTRMDESLASGARTLESAKQTLEKLTQRQVACEQQLTALTQLAHDERPRFTLASYSSDGKRLVLVDERNHFFVYDAQSLAPLSAWDGAAAVPVAAWFAGDRHAITVTRGGQGDGKLQRWAVEPEWKLVRTIGADDDVTTFSDRVQSLDFSPDGALLASGGGEPSRSGQIAIWNVSDGSLVKAIGQPHSDSVFDLAFSPTGEYLASGSADRTVKVFGVATGNLVRTFEGHSDHVLNVSWRANGKQLASSGADHKIKVWDFELGEQRRSIDVGTKEVTAVMFVGTGSQVVSSSGDRSVRIHNADDGAVVRTLSGAAGYLYCCAASETGSLVVAGGADHVLRVWNGADGAELLKLEPPQ